MKKLFILILLPLVLTGCVDKLAMNYRCENGLLLYEFTKSDAATGIVYLQSSGVAKYLDTQQFVKCVK